MAVEPRGLDLACRDRAGEHDLERPLAERDGLDPGVGDERLGLGLGDEVVGAVDGPVELLLQRDHLPAQGGVLGAGGVEGGAGGDGALADGGGFLGGEELGEAVQLAAEVEGQVGGEGEVLELGAGELVDAPSTLSGCQLPLPIAAVPPWHG